MQPPYITFRDLGEDPPPEQVIQYLREIHLLEHVILCLEEIKKKYPKTHENHDIYQANIYMIKIENEAINLDLLLEDLADP
jgi:hypothetical protein